MDEWKVAGAWTDGRTEVSRRNRRAGEGEVREYHMNSTYESKVDSAVPHLWLGRERIGVKPEDCRAQLPFASERIHRSSRKLLPAAHHLVTFCRV